MTQITIRRPDDWHLHLRDGAMLAGILPETTRDFDRAIVMPNLVPPVVTGAQAAAYRDRIAAVMPAGARFTPLMTLYLTDQTTEDTVVAASQSGLVRAFKLYPAGATTNSDFGVNSIEARYPAFAAMEQHNVVLSIHGEVTDN